jgi:predicted metal-dependent phosphoesterase TrpH
MLRLDLHVHSCYSEDGAGTPEEIIAALQKRGLQGVAITDHNTVAGSLKAVAACPKDFVVIPASEVSTADGHLLALNVTEQVPRGKSIQETVDLVVARGGIPIIPHVYRALSGIHAEKLRAISSKISAIEVFNGCSLPRTNLKCARLARSFKLGGTGGSDSHMPEYAGYAFTSVDSTDFRLDTVLSEIEKGRSWGGGETIPLSYRSDRMTLSIRQFFSRGFRRI